VSPEGFAVLSFAQTEVVKIARHRKEIRAFIDCTELNSRAEL
jgi:hypothetical protein